MRSAGVLLNCLQGELVGLLEHGTRLFNAADAGQYLGVPQQLNRQVAPVNGVGRSKLNRDPPNLDSLLCEFLRRGEFVAMGVLFGQEVQGQCRKMPVELNRSAGGA